MNTNKCAKKSAPSRSLSIAVAGDWHPAYIVAELRRAGWSLRRLSRARGYHPNALANALSRPWPKAEAIIAEAIGRKPEEIWPDRFAARASRALRRPPPSSCAHPKDSPQT